MKKFLIRTIAMIPFLALLVVGDHGVATPVAYAFNGIMTVGMTASAFALLSPRIGLAALIQVRRPLRDVVWLLVCSVIMFAAGYSIGSTVMATLSVFYGLFGLWSFAFLHRAKQMLKEKFGIETNEELRALVKDELQETRR
jgi:uncharacterized membrane protein